MKKLKINIRKLFKQILIITSVSLLIPIGNSIININISKSELFAQASIAIPEDMSDQIKYLSGSKSDIDHLFLEIAEVDRIKLF